MQKGDISNRITPRLLLVFEGALGNLPANKLKAYSRATRWGKWEKAVAMWEMNELLCQRLWYVTWHLDFRVELVTFQGSEFAAKLLDRINEEDLPVIGVMASEPHLMARKIVYMPDVAAIYDPDTSHRFTYGSKGRLLLNPNDFGRV